MSAERIARAQKLEAEGDVDGAAREFVAAGAYQEAARAFSMALRPLDAALALLGGIDMISPDATEEQRGRMKVAASLLREGGREEHARLILAALGGGPAFPAAVLKMTAAAAPPRPAVAPARASMAPQVSSPAPSQPGATRSSPFLTRVPVPRTGAAIDPRAERSEGGPLPERVGSHGEGARSRAPISEETIGAPRSPTSSRPSAAVEQVAAPRSPMASQTAPRPSIAAEPVATPRPAATSASAPRPSVSATEAAAASAAVTSVGATAAPSAVAPVAASPVATSPARVAAPASDRPAASPAKRETAARPPRVEPARPARAAAEPSEDRHKAEGGWRAADGAATELAIKQFLDAGRKGAAARVAWEAGQHARALEWFVELGLKYQAGSCLRALGRPEEALATLLEVPTDDSRYRRACFDVVALARQLGTLNFELDRFLTAFVAEGPKEVGECAAYLELAEHYAAAGFAEGARRCGEGVLRLVPDEARAKVFVGAGPARRARGSDRPDRHAVEAADLLSLPSIEEFTALARRNAPKPAGPQR